MIRQQLNTWSRVNHGIIPRSDSLVLQTWRIDSIGKRAVVITTKRIGI